MIVDFTLYTSSDEFKWEPFANKQFSNETNSVTIFGKSSLTEKFGMGVCVLRGNSGKKEIFKSDTIRYSLNIEP